jgi:rubrerythrin
MRDFSALSERELLALAISNEEEDGRIYADFADALAENYPDSHAVFRHMADEENDHRRMLIDLYVSRFGSHIPLIRRADVRGFVARKPIWQMRPLRLDKVRDYANQMERETARFYRQAAIASQDAAVRKLLGDLAAAEVDHVVEARNATQTFLTPDKREAEDATERRLFVLQFVQPGLVGLMDGSVSTLAPVFAAAIATHDSWNGFLVGMAASVGAGISMGFAEALSDDGKLSGRGTPLLRGIITGMMTVLGGIGHTLPFLIGNFHVALAAAGAVVAVELSAITWIRWRYMDSPPLRAAAQIVLGGALVLAAGIAIGGG